ncbi:MAG: DUF4132 domain-containing protein, partial [Desulfobacterales bacterium]|nr:DUF4132 domain-containing protein [Desulfobacterales bacterium]
INEMGAWIETGDGRQAALVEGKIYVRNQKGRVLASVPRKVRETEAVQTLLALKDWLAEHEIECLAQVESWMLNSFPVPASVAASVWPDPSWRKYLKDLVICAMDKRGVADYDALGFFRTIDEKKGLGVVNLDGETEWIRTPLFGVPHPILLEDIEDARELAAELDITQGCQQLLRETFEMSDIEKDGRAIDRFSNGKFEALTHAISRARGRGYRVSGGFAVRPLFERGKRVMAQYWIGADSPEYETWTGELIWTDEKQRTLPLHKLGPVTFSEGMRMAAAIYAGRKAEEDESR